MKTHPIHNSANYHLKIYAALVLIVGMALASLAQAHTQSTDLFTPEQLSQKRLIDRGDGVIHSMTLAEALKFGEKAHKEGRCGGFFDVTDQPQVSREALPLVELFRLNLSERPLTQQSYLAENLGKLDTQRLFKTVTDLSAFKNRFYKSPHGVKAAQFIADEFKAIAKNRSDITVEQFAHKWEQPSVIAMIAGQGSNKNEIVVIGGHLDSINQMAFGSKEQAAPGADDNASGIATVLETFRVIVESGYKPNRTIMFMGYAGEEVGLLGSQDIANKFKLDKKAVVAVAQFDMTGFAGAGDQVVFMTDFTNPELTQFSQKLMDTYVKAKWSTDKCGYACSDHASWTKAGYPSIMPFEATMSSDNKDIHTPRDVIAKLDFKHGLHFAKLALSFVAELAQ